MTQSMWLFRFALPEGKTLGWKEVERHVAWPLLRDCELSIRAEFTSLSPIIMVQWKMGTTPMVVTFQLIT